MNSILKAHLALIGTNVFFAINYSIIKYLINNHFAGALGINLIRVTVSMSLFWILFLFRKEKTFFQKKDLKKIAICALAAIALNQLLFIKGLSYTLAIHASLLTLISPILITLMAAGMLREKISGTKIIGLSLGVLGATLLITRKSGGGSGNNILLGDAMVILSAFAYSLYFILAKPLMDKYQPIAITRWIFTFGFFMTLPLCIHDFSLIQWHQFSGNEWLLLLQVVIPGTFLAYIFNLYGMKVLSASTAGTYIYSQPIFTAIIAIIFLKETFTIFQLIAGILIFAGVYLSTRKPQVA
ncbi:MAG: EamA family transporter [Bacteroidetes bacterium]|nr:EamA family transporter [Bacteroidota bacterium]